MQSFTIPVSSGEIVVGRGEHLFREVLEEFEGAESITVVTYNISKERTALLTALKKTAASVRIISNIPDRFGWYARTRPDLRKRAKSSIERALERLNPAQYGPAARTYFCFRNHAKVVMTEHVAYLGSANFSDESKNNWECGVLVRDEAALAAIAGAVDAIQGDAVRYYGRGMLHVVTPLLAARSELMKLRKRCASRLTSESLDDLALGLTALRTLVEESDGAWAASFDTTGPICSVLDMGALGSIERTLENTDLHDYAAAADSLRAAHRGNLPVDNMRTDRDGHIPESAFEAAIERLERRRRRLYRRVRSDIRSIRQGLQTLGGQLEDVCGQISGNIARIDNTGT